MLQESFQHITRLDDCETGAKEQAFRARPMGLVTVLIPIGGAWQQSAQFYLSGLQACPFARTGAVQVSDECLCFVMARGHRELSMNTGKMIGCLY